ncbi:MAG TPA: hypothetical protein V6C72_14300 [Chroococcales cyanobacterium]
MKYKLLIVGAILLGSACLPVRLARAESRLVNDLLRSRDALVEQRQELEQASDRIAAQIADLQRKQVRIDAYLRDTDHALRNVDSSLRSVQ